MFPVSDYLAGKFYKHMANNNESLAKICLICNFPMRQMTGNRNA